MKAVRHHEYGAVNVLRYEEVPCPEPEKNELLVKVYAAGINPVDWKTRAGGGISSMLGNPLPMIPGWDVSGVVEAVGADVRDFKPGDDVFGMVRFPQVGSAYAQYVTAPQVHFALKPRNVDHLQAAAAPLAALTAWQGLIEHGEIGKGERILVTGAAGGVGHLAVQIAKWKGLYVIGTTSTSGIAFASKLDLDEIVDYTMGRFEEQVEPVDIVFDTVGGETAARALKVVKPGGRLVSIAGKPDQADRQVKISSFLVRPETRHLKQIADLMASGNLNVAIAKVFPLTEVQQAHAMGEAGHLRGKIVLEVQH